MLALQGMHAASSRTFFTDLAPSRGAAGSGGAALDPDVAALADSFVKLKLGPKDRCVAFAESMNGEGVAKVSDLSLVREAEARRMMARAGMSELQQNKVMDSIPKARDVSPALPSAPYEAPDKQVVRPARRLPPVIVAFFYCPSARPCSPQRTAARISARMQRVP